MPVAMVGQDRIQLDVDLAVQQHRGHAGLGQQRAAAPVLLAVDGHDQPVDPAVLQRGDGIGLALGIAAGIDHQQGIAPRAQLRLGAAEDDGMDGVGDVVADEAHGHGVAPAHALGAGIGLEAQGLDGGLDLLQGRAAHRGGGVEGT
jgi:hypothetical protein